MNTSTPTPAPRRPRGKRGFSLIVAVLLGVVTAAVAVGVLGLAGSAKVGAIHSSAGSIARTLAESGMERTEAYAKQVADANTDFDKALDPLLEANCGNVNDVTDTGIVTETGAMNVPRFTDGSTITFNGRRWRDIPYNGGAYLARYDDDDDDAVTASATPDWSTSTNNNKGTVGTTPFCLEGPAATPSGTSGISNPARDRNNAIWATVIGIYPGSDPTTATHRVVLRKLIVKSRSVPGTAKAGIQSGGNFEGDNAVHFCSPIASLNANGEAQAGTGATCYCGKVSKAKPGLRQCNATDCPLYSGCGTNALVMDTSTIPPAPTTAAVNAASWHDWGSSCNFYLDPTLATPALYFWDATAARGVAGNCGSYAGTVPTPTKDVLTDGSCWTPIYVAGAVPMAELSAGATKEVVTTCVAGGAGCVMQWDPRNTAVNYAALSTYFTNGTVAQQSGTKPAWATCPDTAAVDFKWNPPSLATGSGTDVMGCTTCDGAHPTLTLFGAGTTWRFNEATANLQAWPVGVYYYDGALSWTNEGAVPSAPPDQSPASNWPMFTLVTNGAFNVGGGDTALIGAGTRKGDFASIVASSINVSGGGILHTAGSVFSKGIVEGKTNGKMTVYGRIESSGNIHFEAGSLLQWNYDVDMTLSSSSGAATVPPRVSIDIGL